MKYTAVICNGILQLVRISVIRTPLVFIVRIYVHVCVCITSIVCTSVVLVLKFSFSFGFGFLPKLLLDFGIILVYQKFYFQILVVVLVIFNLKFQQEKLTTYTCTSFWKNFA